MSMKYIRDTYKVPAKRGARVRYTPANKRVGFEGVIVGSSGRLLRIRLDGEEQVKSYHPTWRMEYL